MSKTKKSIRGKGRKNDPEWRLLHEQETRKRREELVETFMKDKVAKEACYSRLNSVKLSWHWRSILREMKSEELKAVTLVLQDSFEHLVDTKNQIIIALVDETNECDSQQDNAVTSHLMSLEKLLDIQQNHLDSFQNSYETQKSKAVEMLQAEREDIEKRQGAALQELHRMEKDFNATQDQVEHLVLTEYQSRKDELLNKGLEDQHTLRVQLNIAIEGLWQQFQQLLRNYHANTKEKKKAFCELKARDDKNGLEIALQNKKLQKLEDTVLRLRQKLNSLAKEGNAGNGDQQQAYGSVPSAREEFHLELNRIREKVRKLSEENENRLTVLSVSSNEAIMQLEKAIEKGKQILKLDEMCQKFGNSALALKMPAIFSSDSGYQAKLREKLLEMPSKQSEPKLNPMAVLHQPVESMQAFWRHYNEVYLETCLRREEHRILMEDNVKLKYLLKQYFDGLSYYSSRNHNSVSLVPSSRQSEMLAKI